MSPTHYSYSIFRLGWYFLREKASKLAKAWSKIPIMFKVSIELFKQQNYLKVKGTPELLYGSDWNLLYFFSISAMDGNFFLKQWFLVVVLFAPLTVLHITVLHIILTPFSIRWILYWYRPKSVLGYLSETCF